MGPDELLIHVHAEPGSAGQAHGAPDSGSRHAAMVVTG